MEIVINDTNILIDLYNAGLLPYCKKLNLDFRTLDVVINEIEDSEQYAAVQSIIDEGTLCVCSLTGEQVGTVFQKVAEYNGTRAVAQLWIVRICGRFAIGYNKSLSALGWVGGFCVTLLFFSFSRLCF